MCGFRLWNLKEDKRVGKEMLRKGRGGHMSHGGRKDVMGCGRYKRDQENSGRINKKFYLKIL